MGLVRRRAERHAMACTFQGAKDDRRDQCIVLDHEHFKRPHRAGGRPGGFGRRGDLAVVGK